MRRDPKDNFHKFIFMLTRMMLLGLDKSYRNTTLWYKQITKREHGGQIMETRKEFLEAVMKMANLKDLKEADAAARAVVSLTKLIIGEKLSQKIAEVSPPDLRQGWESIRTAQEDDFARDELLFETGEVQEIEAAL